MLSTRRVFLVLAVWLISGLSGAFAQSAANISIQAGQPGAVISSNLFGIFFEEINSAGEGGLYAEQVRNRSFEDSTNTPVFWSLVTNGTASGRMALDSSLPMSAFNVHALALTMTGGSGGLGAANPGWFGISVSNGAACILNFYARGVGDSSVTASLESAGGTVYAQSAVRGLTARWQKFSLSLVPNATDASARLVLRISQPGTVYLDFVSLFPAATYKNRSNGLRPDLMASLVALHPSFMRFPGGSWVDGMSIANAYHWKLTTGFLPDRTPRNNIWGYQVSNGLGYHEYLQMCEDLGTQPLFDVNCGMDVHQHSVGTANLGPWVQETLDAIQYANGDTNTVFGAQRAANGHPAPFNLQYLEIGNENNTLAYSDNYTVFYDAIRSNYPALHLIANSYGTLPVSRPVEIMDEHYYVSADTFVSYANKYDSYSRTGPKVFVGEYAVAYNIGPGFLATLQNALGEAAFMTGIERNSDIVTLACYAPLFCNDSNQNWTPNLIYFNGAQVYGTPSYYVQQMFSQNRGDAVLPAVVSYTTNRPAGSGPHGAIGVGAWNSSVQYANLAVVSNGVTLYKSDFVDQGSTGWRVFNGAWVAKAGLYQQTSTSTTDCRSTTGSTNWANYTLTLRARKTGGSEGFAILFNWLDDSNWTWLNVGGWDNKFTGIEQMTGGSKTTLGTRVSQVIALNTWYDIRIVLNGSRLKCYVNDTLVQDVTYPSGLNVSASYAKTTCQIILKAVNPYRTPMMTTFNVSGVNSISKTATLVQLTSPSPSDLNSFATPTLVSPVTSSILNAGTNFTITLPAGSFSVIRLQTGCLAAFTNLQWQVPSLLDQGQTVPTMLLGSRSGQSVNLTTNSNHAITYTSADPAIIVVDAHGNLSGVGAGTTSVIATYGSLGLSTTQIVRVASVPPALVHRYSFDESSGTTCADSIGGQVWNGTLPHAGTFSGGQLTLAASDSQYVQLPAGILSNYTAVTIDAWVSFGTLPAACFFYGFGNTINGVGANYIFCQPKDGRIAISDSNYAGEKGTAGGVNWSGLTNLHLTSVYNPPAGYIALYTNGVLVSQSHLEQISFTSVNAVLNYIGRSLYNGDSYFNFKLDEFRIYRGALNSNQITATQALGQNHLLSTTSPVAAAVLAGTNLTGSWPLASAGFKLQSRTNLAPDR